MFLTHFCCTCYLLCKRVEVESPDQAPYPTQNPGSYPQQSPAGKAPLLKECHNHLYFRQRCLPIKHRSLHKKHTEGCSRVKIRMNENSFWGARNLVFRNISVELLLVSTERLQRKWQEQNKHQHTLCLLLCKTPTHITTCIINSEIIN